MPRASRFVGKHLNSVVPFTLYVQRRNIEWAKNEAGPNKASILIDRLINTAREKSEMRKLKSTARRLRIEVARLQGVIVSLGGTVDDATVTDERINEELQ